MTMQTEPGSEPSGPSSTVPPTPPGPPGPSPVSVGWGPAIRWAVATVLALAVLAAVIAFLGASATNQSPGLVLTVRAGGLLFYLFNRVGMVVSVSAAGLGALGAPQGAGSVGITLVVAVLGGSFLAIALLARGGRAIGAVVGGPGWVRGLHGMRVAAPDALI